MKILHWVIALVQFINGLYDYQDYRVATGKQPMISIYRVLVACIQASTALIEWSAGGWHWWYNSENRNPKNMRKRILQMSRSTLEECNRKMSVMLPYRFMYEETPHFEIGYVFGEIVERYRKLVEVVKHTRTVPESFAHGIYHLQIAQYLYLENYHLVMMIHEIPRKYAASAEFATLKKYQQEKTTSANQMSPEETEKRYKELMAYQKQQKKEKKKVAKIENRLKVLEEFQKAQHDTNYESRKPTWKLWPIDYGWEIDPGTWLF